MEKLCTYGPGPFYTEPVSTALVDVPGFEEALDFRANLHLGLPSSPQIITHPPVQRPGFWTLHFSPVCYCCLVNNMCRSLENLPLCPLPFLPSPRNSTGLQSRPVNQPKDPSLRQRPKGILGAGGNQTGQERLRSMSSLFILNTRR